MTTTLYVRSIALELAEARVAVAKEDNDRHHDRYVAHARKCRLPWPTCDACYGLLRDADAAGERLTLAKEDAALARRQQIGVVGR